MGGAHLAFECVFTLIYGYNYTISCVQENVNNVITVTSIQTQIMPTNLLSPYTLFFNVNILYIIDLSHRHSCWTVF